MNKIKCTNCGCENIPDESETKMTLASEIEFIGTQRCKNCCSELTSEYDVKDIDKNKKP